MRSRGASYVEIGKALQRQFALNARQALRTAHGWSQADVAEEWNRRWPDAPKTGKNISYWEVWPQGKGYEPSLQVVDRLAQLYQCGVADLLADLGDYRRMDESTRTDDSAAAEALTLSPFEAPRGWYIKSLFTLVRFDGTVPTALEDRTIVAVADGLAEIDTMMSVPRHPEDQADGHGLEVDLLSGGQLELREQAHESQFRHIIRLARPLKAGDQHQYRLSIRIPLAQLMMHHSVHIPLERSEFYSLTLRFPVDGPLPTIWLVDSMPPAALYDTNPEGPTVELDRFGEVRVNFRSLIQGQAYGLQWRY